MSNIKEKAEAYLKANPKTTSVFATSDGFLFLKKADATEHAKKLNSDSPKVETFEQAESQIVTEDTPKDYSKLRKAELQAELKTREIAFEDTATNAQLIDLLKADDEAKKVGE